jgi:two-component system OmpR family sensor kinase
MLSLVNSDQSRLDFRADWSNAMTPDQIDQGLFKRLSANPNSVQESRSHNGVLILTVPIVAANKVIGAIHVAASESDAFTFEATRLLRGFASIIGLVVNRAHTSSRIDALKHELQEQTKLLAFNTGASSIAHELNASLSTFALDITAAEQNPKIRTNTDAWEFVKKARQMTSTATELTDARVNYAREADFESLQTLNLHEFVHEIISMLRPKARKWNCKLRAESQNESFVVRLKKSKLREILNCLINNAIEMGAREVVVSSSLAWDGSLELRVLDNGPGVLRSHKKTIFKFAFSYGKPKTGHGLGLTLAKYAAETMGGTLLLESGGLASDGGNTVFLLRLHQVLAISAKE